jgi:hypothetical protein
MSGARGTPQSTGLATGSPHGWGTGGPPVGAAARWREATRSVIRYSPRTLRRAFKLIKHVKFVCACHFCAFARQARLRQQPAVQGLARDAPRRTPVGGGCTRHHLNSPYRQKAGGDVLAWGRPDYRDVVLPGAPPTGAAGGFSSVRRHLK